MEGDTNGVVPMEGKREDALFEDYVVQLQQEGYPSQGLLSGLWHQPQWGTGFRAELFRDRCGVWKIKCETLQHRSI